MKRHLEHRQYYGETEKITQNTYNDSLHSRRTSNKIITRSNSTSKENNTKEVIEEKFPILKSFISNYAQHNVLKLRSKSNTVLIYKKNKNPINTLLPPIAMVTFELFYRLIKTD